MNAIQLSLFPARGFCLVLYDGTLAHDATDMPFFRKTWRAAKRAYDCQEAWLRPATSIQRVEVHEAHPTANGKPTYLLRGGR